MYDPSGRPDPRTRFIGRRTVLADLLALAEHMPGLAAGRRGDANHGDPVGPGVPRGLF